MTAGSAFPFSGAPAAIRLAAYLVPLCVLPSAVWRIAVPVRQGTIPGCPPNAMGAWEPVYIAGLSVVSFGAALLTIGLVQRWGVVFPRWLPVLGGRTVPARPVVAVASAGAALIWSVYAWAILNGAFDRYSPAPRPVWARAAAWWRPPMPRLCSGGRC
ncbi:MAG TPA: hypothetical protein VES42_15525 [Pilimelia sp.]|nr:hypothetical protein [Pilimelia sp.]